MSFFVKFWGTRGSIPTPGVRTRVYGGNTSCVELRFDNTHFICDAGSGIRELGQDYLRRHKRSEELHMFFTHTHWDHIQGFPFFAPAYLSDTQIRVYGRTKNDNSYFQLLSGQMTSSYFPVAFGDLGARITSDHLDHGQKTIGGVHVRTFPLRHPGGCHGYLFEREGRKIIYATDAELEVDPRDVFPDPHHKGGLRHLPKELVELFRGADLLIMDAQYTDEEYRTRKGWGHASCFSVTDLAIQAEVKNVALFHHDPSTRDLEVDSRVAACYERAAKFDAELNIFGAREGVELKF